MSELLPSFGSGLPAWVLSMTLWTAGLLALAFAADHLLRRQVAPAWRVGLYGAVFVRVFLPTDWASPLGLRGLWTAGEGSGGIAVAAGPELIPLETPTLIGTQLSTDAMAGDATGVASTSAGIWIALVYLVVAGGLLTWMLFARWRLSRELGESRAARPRLAGLSRANCREHEHLGPLACGITRPVVVLPRALVDELSDEELRCVLGHEEAHLARRDPLLALALSLATALFWPLLPIWLAAARVRHLMELAADERALRGNSVQDYGRTLIKLADRLPSLASHRLPMAAGVHMGTFSRLRGRVESLKRRSRVPGAVQALAVLGMVGLALAIAGQQRVDEPESCDELKQRATTKHDQRERTKDAVAHAESLAAYDAYRGRCSADPDYGEMLYYRAELLWAQASETHGAGDVEGARADFARAHEGFVAALDARAGRYEQDAAYAQLLSKKNELEWDEREDAGCAPGEDCDARANFAPQPYPSAELEMREALETYLAHAESGEEATRARLQLAHIAMKRNHFDEAEPLVRAVVADASLGEQRIPAAEMLTDLLTIRWTEADADPTNAVALDTWLRTLVGEDYYQHERAAKLREAAPTLLAGLMWKRGMAQREAGELQACGDTFMALAAEHPEHERLDAALDNAIGCYGSAGDSEAATRALDTLATLRPESELLTKRRAD